MRARYPFGLLFSYAVASVEVIVILRLLAGPRVHVVAALALSLTLTAAIVGSGLTAARLSSALSWYRCGETPTADQRASTAMLPFRLARVQGAVWVAVDISVLALHYDAGSQVVSLVGICMAFVTVAVGFMNFLLLQRLLRPVFVVARADVSDLRRRRHRVGVRLLVTWGLYRAIPLIGIAALVLDNHFRWLVSSEAAITTPVLTLAGVGIVAGLRGMTLAARSVADPLREVIDRMGHVGASRYEVRQDPQGNRRG